MPWGWGAALGHLKDTKCKIGSQRMLGGWNRVNFEYTRTHNWITTNLWEERQNLQHPRKIVKLTLVKLHSESRSQLFFYMKNLTSCPYQTIFTLHLGSFYLNFREVLKKTFPAFTKEGVCVNIQTHGQVVRMFTFRP